MHLYNKGSEIILKRNTHEFSQMLNFHVGKESKCLFSHHPARKYCSIMPLGSRWPSVSSRPLLHPISNVTARQCNICRLSPDRNLLPLPCPQYLHEHVSKRYFVKMYYWKHTCFCTKTTYNLIHICNAVFQVFF